MSNNLPWLSPLLNLSYLNTWLLLVKDIKQKIDKFDRRMEPLFGLYIFPGSQGQNQVLVCYFYRHYKHHSST